MKKPWIILVLLLLVGTVSAQDTVGFFDTTLHNNSLIFPTNLLVGDSAAASLYTAVAGDVWDTAVVWTRSTSGTSTVKIGLYDVTSGADEATRVGLSGDISVSDNTNASRKIDVNVALVAGNVYMITMCDHGGAQNMVQNNFNDADAKGIEDAVADCPAALSASVNGVSSRPLIWGIITNVVEEAVGQIIIIGN